MTLRPVDSAAARVALHRSARSRGYKLSRERTYTRSLRGSCVCLVFARCVPVVVVCFGLYLPFYSFQGRAWVTFVVER
jgi:hypothetical protein